MQNRIRLFSAFALAFLTVSGASVSAAQTIVNLNWNLGLTGNDAEISVGDSVIWTWTDSAPHTVTSDDRQSFESGILTGRGTTFQHTFTSAGSFPYHCAVHGAASMSGTITVDEVEAIPTFSLCGLAALAGLLLLGVLFYQRKVVARRVL